MCGIAAIIGKDANETVLHKMIGRLAHRGPDHIGTFIGQNVALAQSRLSIIDLTAEANQPFKAIDYPDFTIVFNGEIYNYKDLRRNLEAMGYRFYTNSDTEVLLKLYIEFGEQCVQKLRGMFAFVVWSARTELVFIARDRFGIKPLYYGMQEGTFYFASEVKAFLETAISKRVNYQSLYDYLSLGAICNPDTIFQEIKQFPSGSYASMSLARCDFRLVSYWNLVDESSQLKSEFAKVSYEESVAVLRSSIEEAVKYHLCSDVQVGAFLSGGVDSSLISLLASSYAQNSLYTFSIGFAGFDRYNEVSVAKLVANKIRSVHHEKILEQNDFDSQLERLLSSFDQPSIDGTNSFFVSMAAADAGIKVVLSGLGGDELMAGYPHFRRLRRLSSIFPKGIPWLRDGAFDGYEFLPHRVRFLLRDAISEPLMRYSRLRNVLHGLPASTISSQCMNELNLASIERRYERFADVASDSIELTTLIELNTYLHDTLLRDSDSMSMTHSLELRPVLLDHELVKVIFSLPSHYKHRGKFNKQILVDSGKDLLPEQVYRRKKMGFEFPLGYWIARHRDRLKVTFDSEWAKIVFSAPALAQIQRELLTKAAITNKTWAYFVLLNYLNTRSVQP
jgi:asparagine synthase (glutamine-hydrolysing)